MRRLLLLFGAAVLLGCGATTSEFVASGGYQPRPPSPELLVYFEGDRPDQPFRVIGMVYAEKEADTAVRWDVVRADTVIQLLKAKAQAVGADAIIDVKVMTLQDRARDYKKGEAKAVVFTPTPAPAPTGPTAPTPAAPAPQRLPSSGPGSRLEVGMSFGEVAVLLGEPRRRVSFESTTRWDYADVIIIFENGRAVRFLPPQE